MSRLLAGLLVLPVVLGPACTDSGGTGLEGLFVDGAALEPARESHPYADTLSVSGGQPPFEWDVGLLGGNLPPGLRLSTDGEISGIPESQGTWEFTVRVRSADGKGAWERTTLTTLLLAGNSLSDLEALRGLTNLTTLLLAENSLSDLEPLRDMTDLTVLDLGRNSLSDIDPLGGLTDIRSLELNDNRITDLRALARLTGLAYLDLSGNTELSDIQPLLDNPGLPVHTPWVDGFDLRNTSVPCDDIAALEDRGVFVRSDCP